MPANTPPIARSDFGPDYQPVPDCLPVRYSVPQCVTAIWWYAQSSGFVRTRWHRAILAAMNQDRAGGESAPRDRSQVLILYACSHTALTLSVS